MLIYDTDYYLNVAETYGYGTVSTTTGLEQYSHKWRFHDGADVFFRNADKVPASLITTGLGISGAPHMGTISQIMRAIALQKQGYRVQFVLGDLDSYNARSLSLEQIRRLEEKYRSFITALGFDTRAGILRNQREGHELLMTDYMISKYVKDQDFMDAEEDNVKAYQKSGLYPAMDFPVKRSILLMCTDFIHPLLYGNTDELLVFLGLEEHLYVRLANTILQRIDKTKTIHSIYSETIQGFNNHPKMSKSIPGSAITVEMPEEEIRDYILNREGAYNTPAESVVFQMMCAVSEYSNAELDELYQLCSSKGTAWSEEKKVYARYISGLFSLWQAV